MPHLSQPQALGLALWSVGMVVANSCGLTTVAVVLAGLFQRKEGTLRQRLREWCWDAEDKPGATRREVEVTTCFVPLIRWVLAWWTADEHRLALALDATTLGQRFTVLAISVVYRGCAIPVAWQVVTATSKGAWKPMWEDLFTTLHASVPPDWLVIVLADRGLYASWLYTAICQRGWHPFLRLNVGGTYRRQGDTRYRPFAMAAPGVGTWWCGRVTCFTTRPVACTLLACWTAGHADPWPIMTDLAPEQAEVFWYGLRTWIECGFTHTKRAGWQWQATRMTDPARAARLWLAMAVATLWVVSVGGEAEDQLPASSFDALPVTHVARRCRSTRRARPRWLSCFGRGCLIILVTLLRGESLPQGRLLPEPWPTTPELLWAEPDDEPSSPNLPGKSRGQ